MALLPASENLLTAGSSTPAVAAVPGGTVASTTVLGVKANCGTAAVGGICTIAAPCNTNKAIVSAQVPEARSR